VQSGKVGMELFWLKWLVGPVESPNGAVWSADRIRHSIAQSPVCLLYRKIGCVTWEGNLLMLLLNQVPRSVQWERERTSNGTIAGRDTTLSKRRLKYELHSQQIISSSLIRICTSLLYLPLNVDSLVQS
jgi:hypothetical protein